MDVSIIIINYNTLQVTKNCIDSVIKFTKDINYEILLIDNASSDGSQDFFRSVEEIKFIESKDNLGFGKANNLGYSYSSGKYIFLLNSDTILINNAVKEFFIEAEKTDNSIACFGAILKDINFNNTHSFGYFPNIWSDIYFQLFVLPYNKLRKRNFKNVGFDISQTKNGIVDYVTGADLFIRRDIIENLDFFDNRFFMYYEETDLQKKFHSHGFFSKIIESPKIIHLEGVSSASSTTFNKTLIQLKSRLTYFKKWNYNLTFKFYLFLLIIIRLPFLLFSKYTIKEKRIYLRLLFSFL